MIARDLIPLCFPWFWHDHCPQSPGHHKALADHLSCSHLSPFHKNHFKQMTMHTPTTYLHGLFRLMVQLWKSLLIVFLFSVDVFRPPQLSFRPFHCYQPSQPHFSNASTSLCAQYYLHDPSIILDCLPFFLCKSNLTVATLSAKYSHYLAWQDIKFTESGAFLL